ncbi:hypothetical protein C8R47DRAFT_997974 [Mycena vitilis]|nr:hypothetical protein C8R47DRAFT_997974 [Mycena vitilis]
MSNKNEEAAVVLITGCSTGFGRELAKGKLSYLTTILAANLRVIATARRPESLDSLKDLGAKTPKLDVTAPPDELKQFAAEALSLFGQVDYLINNAGFLQGGAIEENTHEDFFGVAGYDRQGQWLCLAGAGIYCASKAAVDALSATRASELKGFGIRSVSIQLGTFRTSVAESGNLKVAKARIDDSGYDGAHDWVVGFNKRAGKEQGDPALAAAKIIALISDPARTTLPVRLALGDDAYRYGKAIHEKELEELEKWKEVTTGTDVVEN